MSDAEILDWCTWLATDKAHQLRMVRTLLQHANEDRMSVEDRRIYRRALALLDDPAPAPVSPPTRKLRRPLIGWSKLIH